MSFESIVIICVFAIMIVEKIIEYKKENIRYNKEIDLIDRAIPHTTEEKQRQTIRAMINEQITKVRPSRGRPRKIKERVGQLEEGKSSTNVEPDEF